MEALAISAANLETIERNLGAVAQELTGVITNVNDVNNQMTKVENKVESLNDEVKNLVKEIRETTIITNARQNIMYNNAQIEKKYGYYDKVRRTTESLMDAIEHSSISVNALNDLKQELILNNPNYWLSNALAALTSWLLDDRLNTEKELHNALNKDSKKTSLFFCLINLKLNRTSTSINWLNKYLSEQNPLKLDKDFVTVLDLVATGTFGDEAKQQVLSKINIWFERLNSEQSIHDNQIKLWKEYLNTEKESIVTMPTLEIYSPDVARLKENLTISSIYYNLLNTLEGIVNTNSSNKKIEEILSDLIYEYESKEQVYQKDNLKNNLIIQCNGNREEAERLFKKQESIHNQETDLPTLLSNIVIYSDSYKISTETRKIALTLVKKYIINSIDEVNKNINRNEFSLKINDFTTKTIDGKNIEQTKKELEQHLNVMFNEDDKDLILILIIINILGIIGIFITLNNQILSTILIVILVLGNAILLGKLNQRSKYRTLAKNKQRETITNILEKVLAETMDYTNMLNEDFTYYNKLQLFLNNLETRNYTKSNEERNINIEV